MSDGEDILMGFTSEVTELDEAQPVLESEELESGKRYKPNMYKKFLAYRGSTIIMGAQLTLIQAILFAYLCVYDKSSGAVVTGIILMYFGTLITFGWCAIGYVNGQKALDGYSSMVKLGINKAAEIKMGRKSGPELGQEDPPGPEEGPTEDEDLRE